LEIISAVEKGGLQATFCIGCRQGSVFAMAGYFMFRHAGTEVHFCFEDTFCRLINT
jgi:hypothetical protein